MGRVSVKASVENLGLGIVGVERIGHIQKKAGLSGRVGPASPFTPVIRLVAYNHIMRLCWPF